MDLLANAGFGLSSCPGGVEKGAEVICWGGVSLLLGQVRTDRLTASWRGVKNQDSSRVSRAREGFVNIVGRRTMCPPAAQCRTSVGGPKCKEGDWLTLHMLLCHFRCFLSLFRIWQDLLPYRVCSPCYSAQQNLAAGERNAFNIFLFFFKSSYLLHPQHECKATCRVRKWKTFLPSSLCKSREKSSFGF